MNKLLILSILMLSALNSYATCEFDEVTFDDNFPTARLDGCKQKKSDLFFLTINPENQPINSSPWYAFKVKSKKSKNISVKIDFGKPKNRYLPKISTDGINWTSIPHKTKNGDLVFNLKVGHEPIWVAGQEIINNDFYKKWLYALDKNKFHNVSILGQSTENRAICQLETLSESKEWVVILGRMHPPEITGALALFPFSEELLLNKDMGEKFRERFNLLIIPNVNPDGVEEGNWRHNINGKDLNRDWVKFEEKETQLIRDKLQDITINGGKIVYAIDFHSTTKNIFYTMPETYGAKPATLTNDWMQRFDNMTPNFKVVTQAGNNPGKGVFKQFIADEYGVHAITYEMDDDIERPDIKKLAISAARSFMLELLKTEKSDF